MGRSVDQRPQEPPQQVGRRLAAGDDPDRRELRGHLGEQFVLVLADYTTPQRGLGTARVFGANVPIPATVQAPPRYFAGHEFAPASLGPERIAQIQRSLASAGLIGAKTSFRLGVWDAPSSAAYRKLLEFANVYGYDQATALDVYGQAPDVNAGGISGTGDLPRARLSNPTDLAAIVDTVAKATIGRSVDDSFVQRFVSAYQRAELDEANGAASAGGGAFVAAPAPDELAKQMLVQEAPDDAFRQQAISTFAELGNILSGPAA